MTDIRDDVSPAAILAFWRAAGSDRWYSCDDAFDADLRCRFLGLWRKAAAGELSCWEATDDGVLECAVIGVVDARSGEAVKAFVVKKDPNLTAEDIIKFCGTQLTNYKVPKQIEFRTDLPKTNVGKILRRELRDEKKAAAA